ncbi:MAG: DUF3095 family protein [Chitinophagaceae bacterium]
MAESSEKFYQQLALQKTSLSTLLLQANAFHAVPEDWSVIITDIKRSTQAVQEGRHENVNFIATGCIVAVMNIALRENIDLPFFFGGDGATFIVPPSLVDKAMKALLLYRERTRENFELELRTGVVPVKDIYQKNIPLRICKFCFSESFPIPIVLGEGLMYAESIVKGEQYMLSLLPSADTLLDLEGMQCRWDRIPPPTNQQEVVTLLIIARQGAAQHIVFSEALQAMDTIYGSPKTRQPVSVAKLRLKTTFTRMRQEMNTRIGKIKYLGVFYLWLISVLGKLYFKTKKGKEYLAQLVEMCDTLVIDGRINTVITGTLQQRNQLIQVLDKMEASEKILYGMFISNSCVMSCYVKDMKNDHIHFVDGAEGGYTKAAGMLKAKLAAIN